MNKRGYTKFSEPTTLDNMDWDDFRVFLEVVRRGSFNRAATKLNMTQPTVSRRLIRLEKAIGVRLFERDRRGPRLTQKGQRIYNDASAAQAALGRAASQAGQTTKRDDNDCKLYMTDGLASYWTTHFLDSFFQCYPDIEMKLLSAHDSTVDKRTAFDLHVNYYEPADSDLVATLIATLHFIPFASRGYLRAHGRPHTIEDLSQHRLLDLAAYFAYAGSLGGLLRKEPPSHSALYTNLSACLCEAVRHGVGIAILPTYFVLIDDGLVPLDIDMHFHAPVFLSYQRDAVRKWAVRTTLDFLITRVFDRKNMPWFGDSYVSPAAGWPECYAACLRRAAEPSAGDNQKLQSAY